MKYHVNGTRVPLVPDGFRDMENVHFYRVKKLSGTSGPTGPHRRLETARGAMLNQPQGAAAARRARCQ